MKLVKLFPAALTVLALASCSNNDLLGEKAQGLESNVQGDLEIVYAPFEDDKASTRASVENGEGKTFGAIQYEAGDRWNIYDSQLYAQDWYTFQDGAFRYDNNGEKMLTTAAWGLFPGEAVKKTYVDRASRMTRADFVIDRVVKYDKTAEKTVDGKTLYAFNLPTFSSAEFKEGTDYVTLGAVRYLTAILKIDLTNAFPKATYLKLSNANKDLSGTFMAELDAADYKNIKLVKDETNLEPTYKDIYIDMTEVPSPHSVIFLPIVAGLDGALDDIKLEYADYTLPAAYNDIAEANDAGAAGLTWSPVPGMMFPNTVFKAHSRYVAKNEFALTDMNPARVSKLLAQYSESGNDIDLNISGTFTINGADPDITDDIILPACDKNITINLSEVAPLTSTDQTLHFVNEDNDEPFTGTITLDLGDLVPTANQMNINIDAPGANVVLAGDFSAQETLALANANSVEIGEGANFSGLTALNWGAAGEGVKTITIAKDATVTVPAGADLTGTVNEEFIVNGNCTATNIALSENTKTLTVGETGVFTATTITVNNVYCNVTVEDEGQIVGDVDAAAVKRGIVTVTSETNNAITGNVTTTGDVIVNTTEEAVAIAGKLIMKGTETTLTLVQGYIGEINVATVNAGDWEDKFINIKLDSDGEGFAAFATLDIAADNSVKYTKSVWNGEYATIPGFEKTSVKFDGTAKSSAAVFTATQLARSAASGHMSIMNEIDLNNSENWTGFDLNSGAKFKGVGLDFDNQSLIDVQQTISNLNLSNAEARGLINLSKAALVQYIKLDGVKGEKAADDAKLNSLGSLIGLQQEALNVEAVDVTGIDLNMTANTNKKIGGLIGANSAAVTLKDITTAGQINGYQMLGGIIGNAQNDVTINSSTSTVTFKQDYDSELNMDVNYARIGGFIGSAQGTHDITIDENSTATEPTHAKVAKEYVSSTTVGAGNFYTYAQKQNFIGYCGANTTEAPVTVGTVTIGGVNYMVPKFSTELDGLNRTTEPYDEPLYDFATTRALSR